LANIRRTSPTVVLSGQSFGCRTIASATVPLTTELVVVFTCDTPDHGVRVGPVLGKQDGTPLAAAVGATLTSKNATSNQYVQVRSLTEIVSPSTAVPRRTHGSSSRLPYQR